MPRIHIGMRKVMHCGPDPGGCWQTRGVQLDRGGFSCG